MSTAAMRAAIETALLELGWDDRTAFENSAFAPRPDTPFQRVTCGFGRPAHRENTGAYTQLGWCQIDLMYPSGEDPEAGVSGAGEATARAEAIQAAFPRARSIEKRGVVTQIDEAAEILPARLQGDRYVIPVVIRFSAQIQA